MIKKFYWKTRELPGNLARRTRSAIRRACEPAAVVRDILIQADVFFMLARHVVAHRPQTIRNPSSTRSVPPKRSVLVISYYSPPYRSVHGTQRITKYMKYLHRMGWEVTLLTTSPGTEVEQDNAGEGLLEGIHINRLPTSSRRSTLAGNGWLVPDDFISWVRPAITEATRLIIERNISVVVATAPPYSNLLAGVIAANRAGVPFIPDFRDPWSKIDIGWVINRPGLSRLNTWMEKIVLRRSTKVVITDDLDYISEYLADASELITEKTVSITNGYDEEDFLAIPPVAAGRPKFTVSYVGTLYNQETFDNLITPFRIWRQRHPADLVDTELVYAGSSAGYFHSAKSLPFAFRDHGYVTHLDAINLRMNSDLQLFSQPRSFKPHVYSGKIFEMLRVGVPILAITRPDGAVSKLIERTRSGFGVDQSTPEAAADKLKQSFDCWKRGDPPVAPDLDAIHAFSREALAAKLSDTLEDTLDRIDDGFRMPLSSATKNNHGIGD